MILPVAGTREALFLAALLAVPELKAGQRPAVLLPNPFYAAYEGAAVMAGAEAVFLTTTRETGFLPDLDALSPDLLERTALFYLCTPSNPQGAVAGRAYLERAILLARRQASCWRSMNAMPKSTTANRRPACSKWRRRPAATCRTSSSSTPSPSARTPPGCVPASWPATRSDRAVLAAAQLFHRRHAAAGPGRRGGAVGRRRTCGRKPRALPPKFDAAQSALEGRFGFYRPAGGFFLWLDVGDGEAATVRLWRDGGIKVLPGAYLTRPDADGINRGSSFIRIALVHDAATVAEACTRISKIL